MRRDAWDSGAGDGSEGQRDLSSWPPTPSLPFSCLALPSFSQASPLLWFLSMRRRAAPPPNQPLYPTAPASSQRPPAPLAQTAATSPYAAGGFTPATTLYPGARPQQASSYGASSVGGGANYGSSSGDESKDLAHTALLHAKWALRGWHDAARPLRVWEMISR